MNIPQLAMPDLAMLSQRYSPQTAGFASDIVSRFNQGKNNTLDSYLAAREQLQGVLGRGARMRYGGGSSGGSTYGSSGPSSGGGRIA
jgi:hypothetical protein